jgi:hypothetical protein
VSSARRLADRLADLRSAGGRSWIVLVAFALIGIVAMQLWVVKLSVGIGRALEHTALLQRQNSALSIEASTRSSGERIERLAAARGMTIAPPGALHFETIRGPLDARLAAAALARPTQAQTVGSPAGGETGAGEAAAQATSTGTAPTQSPTPAAGEVSTTASAPAGVAPQASSTPAPASTPAAGGVSQTAVSSPAPAAAGGASQAPGATPATPGGGTQAAPGG